MSYYFLGFVMVKVYYIQVVLLQSHIHHDKLPTLYDGLFFGFVEAVVASCLFVCYTT